MQLIIPKTIMCNNYVNCLKDVYIYAGVLHVRKHVEYELHATSFYHKS